MTKRKDSPQKATMGEIMCDYLKNNDITVATSKLITIHFSSLHESTLRVSTWLNDCTEKPDFA